MNVERPVQEIRRIADRHREDECLRSRLIRPLRIDGVGAISDRLGDDGSNAVTRNLDRGPIDRLIGRQPIEIDRQRVAFGRRHELEVRATAFEPRHLFQHHWRCSVVIAVPEGRGHREKDQEYAEKRCAKTSHIEPLPAGRSIQR